jgi:hypothetical protein
MKRVYFILVLILCLTSCKAESDQARVERAIENTQFPLSISHDLTLISEWSKVQLHYESSHPDILEPTGIIHPLLHDVHVVLTVTFTYQSYSKTKTFDLTVKGRTWTVNDIIEQDLLQLKINIDRITQDIPLPKTGMYGSVITWSSSHPHIVSHQGKYYAPLDEEHIVLTATLHYEGEVRTKTFPFVVQPISDTQKVDMAYEMLSIQTSITEDIVLPNKGYFGVSIDWVSSHPNVLSSTGQYNIPVGTINLTLTATLTSCDISKVKVFDLTITGLDPSDFLNQALIALEPNHGIDVLFESITLPTSIMEHVAISWASSHNDLLSTQGELILPKETTTVYLTAYLSVSGEQMEKVFTYLLIGTEENSSDLEPKSLDVREISLNVPLVVDSGIDLTLGTFDGVIMKSNHLVLLEDKLIGSYTSPIYLSEPFKRVNVIWGSITHSLARTQMHVRSMINHEWSSWTLLGDWGYGGPNLPPTLTYQPIEPSTQLQYKITLTRASAHISSPRLHSVSLNYVLSSPNFEVDINNLPKHVFYDLPQLRQADTEDTTLWNNICWGTSISMVLQYMGKLTHMKVPQAYYAPLIKEGTTKYGTTKNDIGATQFGVHVSVIEFESIEMLLYMIYHYGPIIVGVSKGSSPTGKFGPLTFNTGHVIVVVGYEINPDNTINIIVNDPAVSWIREPFVGSAVDFMLVWDKGGVIMRYPSALKN